MNVTDVFIWLGTALSLALASVKSTTMSIAMVLLAAIAAGVGGMFGWRMRLYGALVGAMLMNAVVKAMGGGYEAALAAMLAVAVVGFLLGTLPFVGALLRHARPRQR